METTEIQTLNRMKTGQKGIITALNGGHEFQARLVSMGVHIGRDFEIVHSGSGRGGPTLIAIGDARIAVGQGMLERILVAVDPE